MSEGAFFSLMRGPITGVMRKQFVTCVSHLWLLACLVSGAMVVSAVPVAVPPSASAVSLGVASFTTGSFANHTRSTTLALGRFGFAQDFGNTSDIHITVKVSWACTL